MMYRSIISAAALHDRLHDEQIRLIDCRYDLMDHEAGFRQYQSSHIPGAVFADVKSDLSGPPLSDCGRHPLPSESALNNLFSRLGIDEQTQVVVYDDSKGAFAARLWWLLNYMGHESVALLDGGWSAWLAADFATTNDIPVVTSRQFNGVAQKNDLVLLDQVAQQDLLIDSREPARYRGEQEPIDPKAGHIPSALNRFWQQNLTAQGTFKAPKILHAEFSDLCSTDADAIPVFYCGSGVTACHNLLAYYHAGLTPAKLYAGSWSEWCSDSSRPIATISDK